MTTEQRGWILGGGLASGKSTVRQALERAGVETIDADRVGHAVLEPEGGAFGDVSRRWPDVVEGGRIDRAALAAVVFHDPVELEELESLTHPHIFDMIAAQVEQIEGPVVVEVPVMTDRLGTGWRWMVVDARHEAKMERAMERGMDADDARARLARQPTREQWLAVADLVIPNHGSLSELDEAVAQVVDRL